MNLSPRKHLTRAVLIIGLSLTLFGSATGDLESALAVAVEGVNHNGDWEPYFERLDGVLMALVPTGCFMMGGEEFRDEQPIHEICIEEPFWIDVCEVTTAEFADFMNRPEGAGHTGSTWVTGYNSAEEQFERRNGEWVAVPGYEKSAVFGVTWHEATAYCACRGARLATEAEWAFAARGPDSLVYPWGNELVTENIARFGGGMPITEGTGVPLTIGTKPAGASWVGALDMVGNASEWVSSLYRPYPYDAADGREVDGTVDPSSPRVMRGWSWYHPNWIDPVRANDRFCSRPDEATRFYGFRCARDFMP